MSRDIAGGGGDPRQLDWLPDEGGPRLAPAVSPALADLADAIDPSIRLGTSSWSFPGWDGLVYDGRYSDRLLSQRGLLAYSKHPLFRSVGIDRGFYGPIEQSVLQRWASQVPQDFRFLIKADAQLTSPWGRGPRAAALSASAPTRSPASSVHSEQYAQASTRPAGPKNPAPRHHALNPEFLSASFAREQVFEPAIRGLGDKLGCLLLQFPPFDPTSYGGVGELAQRLFRVGKAVSQQVPCSVEFRHPGWVLPEIAEVLETLGWSWGLVVWPGMPDLRDQLRVAASTCRRRMVIRWMLHAGQSYATAVDRYEPFDRLVDPDPTTRDTIARILLRALERSVDESYVIINNKAEGSSPRSILALAERLALPRQQAR